MQGTAALLLSLLGSVQAQTNDGVHAAANGAIYAFGVQLDGKVIVGGAFTNLAGQVRSHIGRLNPNGTLDPLFNPSPINSVNALLIQPDGQIVAASTFNIFSGYNLVRMKPDGTADNSFHVTASDAVSCLALQSDGKILLGGAFKIVQGQSRNLLARLNPNGTLDTAFHPIIVGTNAFPYSGMDEVLSIALQADGNILIGGSFTSINGTGCTNLGRLYSDGTLDSTFVPPRIAYPVQCVTIQPDGKILAGLAGPVEPSLPFFPPGTNFL